MAEYINLRGHQVWSHEYEKNGEPLVLLHGGLSYSEKILPYLLPAIERDKTVYAYDRSGHGHTGYREGAFTMEHQRDELIAYIEDVIHKPAHLIGHSDGANAAVMVALKRPDLVKSLVAIGPALKPGDNVHVLPENPTFSPEDQAEHDEISPDAPELFARKFHECFAMWVRDPQIEVSELASISCPTLFLLGDDDVITNAKGEEYAKAVRDGRLAVVPGASHDVIKEKTFIVQSLIVDFYATLGYPQTKYPNWRS